MSKNPSLPAPQDRTEPTPPVRDMGEPTEYGDRICEFCNQQVPARHRCVEVAAPARAAEERTEPNLAWRLGCMADAVLSAKVGPQARFFTRQRVDEIVLLLREAERAVLRG